MLTSHSRDTAQHRRSTYHRIEARGYTRDSLLRRTCAEYPSVRVRPLKTLPIFWSVKGDRVHHFGLRDEPHGPP